ncbi:MAG: HD domain-containing protein, partial [Eubacterium sp.]|nr:HD domain-containing protein [Eubacterium sp.]
MKYSDILQNEEILEYYERGNALLDALGYTDHSVVHTRLVAEQAAKILLAFQYSPEEVELARIAGYMHDIGNAVNRHHHAEYGALLANEILKETDLSIPDRVRIVSAIANHDESDGVAADPVAAALIIADKTDVRRNRVREKDPMLFDVHDRVNHAVTAAKLRCGYDEKRITLYLTVDENICTMYEYFDIFLNRMTMCSHAARIFVATFS